MCVCASDDDADGDEDAVAPVTLMELVDDILCLDSFNSSTDLFIFIRILSELSPVASTSPLILLIFLLLLFYYTQ